MNSLTRAERLVMKGLFAAADGLHLYTLHTRFMLPPGTLVTVIKSLEKKGCAIQEDGRVFITNEGRELGHRARFDYFETTNKPWREVPENFKARVKGTKDPYVPNIQNLHWSLLPKSIRGKV